MFGRKVMGGIVAAAVVVGAGGWAVESFATSSTPSGTGLCIASSQSQAKPVLNPTNGACKSGYALVTVANNSDLVSVVNQVNTLQSHQVARFTANGSYTVPSDIHQLEIEAWGGGGGGGGGSTGNVLSGGGGGAESQYEHIVVNVTPGQTCSVVVGTGGAGGAAGADGQDGTGSSTSCGGNVGGGGGGQSGDAGSAGGTSPSAGTPTAFSQGYAGISGDSASLEFGGDGGGGGAPGAGGGGGSVPFNPAGSNGAPGLVLITPMG